MRSWTKFGCSAVAAMALLAATGAQAALITNGFTFAVATGSDTDIGTHFHSSTGGDYGNPAGKAEVGRFTIEEVRGLSEYDLTGLGSSVTSAFVTFNVYKQGGLFSGVNDTPFTGTILIDAYAGNNAEDISDYEAATRGGVGSFSVTRSPTSPALGTVFSFDITALLNAALADSLTSFGIRLREDRGGPDYESSRAWTFDNFRLTTDDQSTGTVPLPATFWLFGIGLAALFGVRRTARS
ncbi:MAG: PEP-CTERM sorting domain-containing protein [Burkholderiales bacterium]|nr:PEP-CTERM sorting domain-containing protein [Burkholderiales bacterium]